MNPTRERQLLMGKDRPGMEWRRVVDSSLYRHKLYGDVKLLATDGVRAIVECCYGKEREHVMFGNLTEVKVSNFNFGLRKPKGKQEPSEKELSDKAAAVVAKLLSWGDFAAAPPPLSSTEQLNCLDAKGT